MQMLTSLVMVLVLLLLLLLLLQHQGLQDLHFHV
jgi:hypothetical protein